MDQMLDGEEYIHELRLSQLRILGAAFTFP